MLDESCKQAHMARLLVSHTPAQRSISQHLGEQLNDVDEPCKQAPSHILYACCVYAMQLDSSDRDKQPKCVCGTWSFITLRSAAYTCYCCSALYDTVNQDYLPHN